MGIYKILNKIVESQCQMGDVNYVGTDSVIMDQNCPFYHFLIEMVVITIESLNIFITGTNGHKITSQHQ